MSDSHHQGSLENTIPDPCYSKCGPQSGRAAPGSLFEMQNLSSQPRPTDSELHFQYTSRDDPPAH